jgi:methionine salvage enolase-phosphatase E1
MGKRPNDSFENGSHKVQKSNDGKKIQKNNVKKVHNSSSSLGKRKNIQTRFETMSASSKHRVKKAVIKAIHDCGYSDGDIEAICDHVVKKRRFVRSFFF